MSIFVIYYRYWIIFSFWFSSFKPIKISLRLNYMSHSFGFAGIWYSSFLIISHLEYSAPGTRADVGSSDGSGTRRSAVQNSMKAVKAPLIGAEQVKRLFYFGLQLFKRPQWPPWRPSLFFKSGCMIRSDHPVVSSWIEERKPSLSGSLCRGTNVVCRMSLTYLRMPSSN